MTVVGRLLQGEGYTGAQPFGHAALGDVKAAQKHTCLPDRIADNYSSGEFMIERRPRKRFVDVEQLGARATRLSTVRPRP